MLYVRNMTTGCVVATSVTGISSNLPAVLRINGWDSNQSCRVGVLRGNFPAASAVVAVRALVVPKGEEKTRFLSTGSFHMSCIVTDPAVVFSH